MALLFVGALGLKIQADLVPAQNEIALAINDPALAGLRVAVLSDLHLSDDPADLSQMARLLETVNASKPDLFALLGDYTANPRSIKDPTAHRESVARLFASLQAAPVVAVLGNYESWDDRLAWGRALQQQGVIVLENDVAVVTSNNRLFCVRGIGDAFTGYHQETPFPDSCQGLARLTLTHDPFAAFALDLQGLVLAGHTHCGQLRIPVLGPLWIPSKVPHSASCGRLMRTRSNLIWVTSGLGASGINVRLFAPAAWDLLHLQMEGPKN